MLGFLIKEFDDDWVNFLKNVGINSCLLIPSNKKQNYFDENVEIVFSDEIANEIKERKVETIFIDRELDLKFSNAENIKIIENEYEKEIYKGYDAYALRSEKKEGFIYLPYFVDYEYFSNFKPSFPSFEKKKRILVLTKGLNIDIAILFEKFFPIFKKYETVFYKLDLPNRKNIIFISRSLNKKERAELFYFSSVIFAFENFKKEVLEAMSMGKIVYSLDGSYNSLKFSLNDNLEAKINRALEFNGYYPEMKAYAKDYNIEKVANIFKKELEILKII